MFKSGESEVTLPSEAYDLDKPMNLPVSGFLTFKLRTVIGPTSLGSIHELICGKGSEQGLTHRALHSDDIDCDDYGNRPPCSPEGLLWKSQDFTLLEKSLLIFYCHH